MRRFRSIVPLLAASSAAAAFATIVVQDPSSPIELRPLGDLSQGTCTNGAPPLSLGLSPVDPGGEITPESAGLESFSWTPSWWADYGVLTTDAPDDDAAATLGQLRWLSSRAAAMLDDEAWAEGGAGTSVWSAVSALETPDDYLAATSADLWSVATPFAERNLALDTDHPFFSTSFPWLSGPATNAHDLELVNLSQLKFVFSFDLSLDSNANDLPDWWERLHGIATPYPPPWPPPPAPSEADADLDGLPDADEYAAGTDPSLRDTDGDGLVDGSDPDPLSPDPGALADLDGDGLPDAWEVFRFGSLSEIPYPEARTPSGFFAAASLRAGVDPQRFPGPGTNPVPQLGSIPLVPRFSAAGAAPGEVLWEKTVAIGRHAGWEQFYVSSHPDPWDLGAWLFSVGAWSLSGIRLEWEDDCGATGSATASPTIPGFASLPLYLPLSTNGPTLLTLRLVATSATPACPQPLHLLAWTPVPFFPDLAPAGALPGEQHVFAGCNETNVLCSAFSGERSPLPGFLCVDSHPALPDIVLPLPPGTRCEAVPGGSGDWNFRIRDLSPGAHVLPFAPVLAFADAPPLRSGAPSPAGDVLLQADPDLHFVHDYEEWSVTYDDDYYSVLSGYPLDTQALWHSFHTSVSGEWHHVCRPEISLGLPDEYARLFTTNLVADGRRADATVSHGGETLWSGTAWDDCDDIPFFREGEGGSSCGCADPADLDGPALGSLAFRVHLGAPRPGQVSGFLWFRADEPPSLSPSSFSLLLRPDASATDETDPDTLVRTVSCADPRGRTVEISPIPSGVRLDIRSAATGEPEPGWTLENEPDGAVLVRKLALSGAPILSRRYRRAAPGEWTEADLASGAVTTLCSSNLLSDASSPVLVEERAVSDSSGRVLSRTRETFLRHGDYSSARLRPLERREAVGTPFETVENFLWWNDPETPRRHLRPRLASGSARAWRWTDFDDLGRETLLIEQRDGSELPSALETDTRWTLGALPPGLTAFATATSYDPLPGDSADPLDEDRPRTVSRYLLSPGEPPLLLSRSWTTAIRSSQNGRPVLILRAERAGDPGAAPGDLRNAVSTETLYDPDRPGVPLLLRSLPLSETDEDGRLTAYNYDFGAWDPASLAFTPAPAGPFLRSRALRATASAPSGVPGLSTVSETVQDAASGLDVFSATRALLPGCALSEPFDWEARSYDSRDRLRSTRFPDGTLSTNDYSCCRLLSTTGRDGFRTLRSARPGSDRLYYAMEEVSLALLPHATNAAPCDGWTPSAYRVTQRFLDPLGRETNRVVRLGNAPGQAQVPSFAAPWAWTAADSTAYPDGVSARSVRRDARGSETESIRYETASATASTNLWRSGWLFDVAPSYRIQTSLALRNGQSRSLRFSFGWGEENETETRYGPDGCRTTRSAAMPLATGVPATNSIVRFDFLGRALVSETPLSSVSNAYAGASSRVLFSHDARSGLATTNLFDALGDEIGSVGPDGVAAWTETAYLLDASNALWRVSSSYESATGRTNLLSRARERLTGLSPALCAETVETTAAGASVRVSASFDPLALVRTETTERDGFAPEIRKTMFGREIERTGPDGTVRSFYDPFGRLFTTERIPAGESASRPGPLLLRDRLGDLVRVRTPLGPGTWTDEVRRYDSSGHLYETDRPDGTTVQTVRSPDGRTLVEKGDAAIPASFDYDDAGRRTGLYTTRDGASWDATRWAYDAATGLCTNKTYADGTSVSHAYAPDGRPLRTTLASGAWTESEYDGCGRLRALWTSDYLGDYELEYDDFGRVSAVSDWGTEWQPVFARDALGRVTNETWTGGGFQIPRVRTLRRALDAHGRLSGWSLSATDPVSGPGGQHFPVSSPWGGGAWGYGPDGRPETLCYTNGANRRLDVLLEREDGRLAAWTFETEDGGWFERFAGRDPFRPWRVAEVGFGPGGMFRMEWLSWTRDPLDRPVRRIRTAPGSVSTNLYAHDARGQVTNAVFAGASPASYAYDEIGNRRTSSDLFGDRSYLANAVNQYTAVTNLSAVPPAPVSLSHDSDGNLLSLGGWSFSWDARGRLLSADGTTTAGRPVSVDYYYDWMGRLTRRHARVRVSPGTFEDEDREYFWDDWLLLHERVENSDGSTTDLEYVWGPDLSETFQGAGGVGGLLAVSVDGDYFFPAYDDNGNVVAYFDETGAFAARYDYDAFGNTIASSGPLSDDLPHRFSTKYFDPDLGLYYYGLRWYSPELGRWISRDPIEEADGFNLFGFTKNNPAAGFDAFGLYRYITDFAIWKPFSWHIGIAVDTWRKVKTGSEECCWAWTWMGLKRFDFQMDPKSPLGYTSLFTTYAKSRILETDDLQVWAPRRVLSIPEQDIAMLQQIQREKRNPALYHIFLNNCMHWAWSALTYGLDKPPEPSCRTPRIIFDSNYTNVPLLSAESFPLFR